MLWHKFCPHPCYRAAHHISRDFFISNSIQTPLRHIWIHVCVLNARIIMANLHPIVRRVHDWNPGNGFFRVRAHGFMVWAERANGIVGANLVAWHSITEIECFQISLTLPTLGSIEQMRAIFRHGQLVQKRIFLPLCLLYHKTAHHIGREFLAPLSSQSPLGTIRMSVRVCETIISSAHLYPFIHTVQQRNPRHRPRFHRPLPSQRFRIWTKGTHGQVRTQCVSLLSLTKLNSL
mmetsp:Transcript_631/g.1321  ORF Transcript_631/g.1321 Transcript_631/m.1321 type:complete len:234 (-) Transcript_631:606-1307(-)